MLGLVNFRDVGAPDFGSGTHGLRIGRLFRSDSLAFAHPSDLEAIQSQLGIGAFVDLRVLRDGVDSRPPGLEAGHQYRNVSLYEIDLAADRPDGTDPLGEIYMEHLHHDRNLPTAIELLAEYLAGSPTVVFCGAGKDRTGMVIALALGLAGFSRDLIIRDYMRSGPSAAALAERARRDASGRSQAGKLPPVFFECQESSMVSFLDAVDREYGSFDGWAQSTGIAGRVVTTLREALTKSPDRV